MPLWPVVSRCGTLMRVENAIDLTRKAINTSTSSDQARKRPAREEGITWATPGWMDSSGHGGYAFGPFVVDAVKRTLWRERRLVPITSKTFDVLVVLLEHRDHIVSKDELLNRVWPDTAVNENNLARQISSLRRALGQRPDQHDFVVTIPGHGYRFVASVQHLPEVPIGVAHEPWTRPTRRTSPVGSSLSWTSTTHAVDEPLSGQPIRSRHRRRADSSSSTERRRRWTSSEPSSPRACALLATIGAL